MAERRKKSHSLLLRAGGKTWRLGLYPSSLWPEASGGESLYRLRINGVWHCPAGRYSFLTREAILRFAVSLLLGGEAVPPPAAPEWIVPGVDLRVHLGACVSGLPALTYRATALDYPLLGPDGRFYVECRVFTVGRRFVLADDAEPFRKMEKKHESYPLPDPSI